MTPESVFDGTPHNFPSDQTPGGICRICRLPWEHSIHQPVYDLQKHNKERAMPQEDDEPVRDPMTLDDIKAAVRTRHERAVEDLAREREYRDQADHSVRRAVLEEKEARRILHSLEPRKAKKS